MTRPTTRGKDAEASTFFWSGRPDGRPRRSITAPRCLHAPALREHAASFASTPRPPRGHDVAELRQNLPTWLDRVRIGEEVVITEHGTAIARILPPTEARAEARRTLEELRSRARVGDVESPLGETWDATDDSP